LKDGQKPSQRWLWQTIGDDCQRVARACFGNEVANRQHLQSGIFDYKLLVSDFLIEPAHCENSPWQRNDSVAILHVDFLQQGMRPKAFMRLALPFSVEHYV
jgi:hypothetical protein